MSEERQVHGQSTVNAERQLHGKGAVCAEQPAGSTAAAWHIPLVDAVAIS
jgi:hypothetical protein